MREGLLIRAPIPYVEVLHLEPLDAKRQASDLLPYLENFRPLFTPLPNSPDDMRIRVTPITVESIEAVTDTLVKFDGPHWYLNIVKGMKVFCSHFDTLLT